MSMPRRALVHRYVHPVAFSRTIFSSVLIVLAMLAMTAVQFHKQMHLASTAPGNPTGLWDVLRIYGPLFGMPALLLLTIPALYAMKRQVLWVDDFGLRFDNGGGALADLMVKPWSLRWDEIQSVEWRFNRQYPHLSRLVLQTAKGERTLVPWLWPDKEKPLPKKPFGLSLKSMGDKRLPQLAKTPLVQAIETARLDLGLQEMDPRSTSTKGSGLTGVTPLTGVIAATMAFGVVYFITEVYFTLSEFYVAGPPWFALVAAAILAAVFIYVLLGIVEPKRKDSAAYALLFALAVGFIAYPLSIRISLWTAPSAEASSQYELGRDYVWHPKNDTSLPALHLYLQSSKWWRQFKPGDTHAFVVQRGGLGRWLVDMGRICDEQQAFYQCHGVLDCMNGGH